MSNKFIIKEEEKSEILKKHTDFKKTLQEELSNLNRGLVNEQFNTGVVKDPLLAAAENAKCISGGKQITWEGKPGYYKVATADREGRFSILTRYTLKTVQKEKNSLGLVLKLIKIVKLNQQQLKRLKK